MSLSWLDRRPVLATILTAAGLTGLAAGLVGLLAPLSVLDGLWQLGDPRLLLALAGFFVASLAAAGIGFAQRAIAPDAAAGAEADPEEDSTDSEEDDTEGDVAEATEEASGAPNDGEAGSEAKDKPRFFT